MVSEVQGSSSAAISQALADLRARQGEGARYDSDQAPAVELDLARRGTAYFARKLNELPERELLEQSLLSGWTKAELIAHVGYNGRALTRLVEWARTGVETPMYLTDRQRNGEIQLGGTLPSAALRNLFAHSATHINVEWRDLEGEQWDHLVRTAQGREVPVRETAWMRTREVWVHAIDLGNGGSFEDFPPLLLTRLIEDVQAAWNRRKENPALSLVILDSPRDLECADTENVVSSEVSDDFALSTPSLVTDVPVVSGTRADIARWLTGRGAHNLVSSSGALPRIRAGFSRRGTANI